jgi:hypothetical protein
MSGIILLLILSAWFYAVKKLSGLCTSKMLPGTKKIITYRILFALFFIAPVVDDIIGGFQFRNLCDRGIEPVYDEEKIRGKTLQLKNTQDRIIKKVVPIREQVWNWVDSNTGETLISYKNYYASGGWLSHLIGFPQSSPPYTFDGSCGSREIQDIFDKFNITKNTTEYYGE